MGNYIDPSQTSLALSITNQATKYILEYLRTPSLNGIPIYTYEYRESSNSNVSEQMIIDPSGGMMSYSDNVVLKPKEWTLKGYLKPTPLELTNYFLPSLQFQKYGIMSFRSLRVPIIFKDPNQQIHQVFIQNLGFPQKVDEGNVLPIDISFKEVNILSSVLSQSDMVAENATAPVESVTALSSNIGSATPSILSISVDIAATSTAGINSYLNEILSDLINNYEPMDREGNAA